MSTIYVYCNIAQPQIVGGDTNAQLLKSSPVEVTFGDIIAKKFTKIQYVPVQTKSFEEVEIVSRNEKRQSCATQAWEDGDNTAFQKA